MTIPSKFPRPLFFILPWIVAFLVFWLYPLSYSFYLSFTDYSLINPDATRWTGFANYNHLFQDPLFWIALKNTLFFSVGTIPITVVLAIAVANTIHHTRRLQFLFRSAVFIPSMVSITVLSLIFVQFYSAEGYLNGLAGSIGLSSIRPGILLNERMALAGVMAMDVFVSAGYFSILFLAAIKNIPEELYESAEISGADGFQKFWYITLPLLRPMILFSVVVSTIKSLQVFTEIFIMTKGGPLHATTTIVYRIYELGFREFQMGYASAMAYVLLAIIGLAAWMQIRLLRKRFG
jgi:multiple sugar transport system permease protein